MFFGESMFSRSEDASKVALGRLVEIAFMQPFQLIDCQIHTDHLARLGAREISREAFQRALDETVGHAAAPLGRQASRPAARMRWAA